ncbi:MAG: FtsW/RodA/SpoVE family cell cycle protein [Planctomycetota bacterium]
MHAPGAAIEDEGVGLRAGDVIALAVLAMLTLGMVMVHSALFTTEPGESVRFESILLSRQTAYLALAIGAFYAVSLSPIAGALAAPSRARWLVPCAALSTVALLGVYVPGLADPANNAHRWIKVPGVPLSFQPSEVTKWIVPLAVAWIGVRLGDRLATFRGVLGPLALLAVPVGIIVIEDLGTGVLIGAVGVLVLVAAGARLVHLAAFAPVALGALVGAVVMSPYRVRRLTTFLDPTADPEGAGYHILQSISAITGGDIVGRGLGFGYRKFGYLPEDHTDFLFAVICEELGLAGALLTLSLYGAVIIAAATILRGTTAVLAKLAVLGILLTFALQAVMNLFVVTAMAPTKGIALPLMSAGGTGWVLTAASLGVVVAIDRWNRGAVPQVSVDTSAEEPDE